MKEDKEAKRRYLEQLEGQKKSYEMAIQSGLPQMEAWRYVANTVSWIETAIQNELPERWARLKKARYDALLKVGFNEERAMRILEAVHE